ncbi:MAG: hypothetical protein NTZ20_05465 [Candidatus Levybacteria bacterium]|nr:hypothetical protein [Candidatus Levybacteria bacterium]
MSVIDDLILQRFVEIERNIRDMQTDIKEIRDYIHEIRLEIDEARTYTDNEINGEVAKINTQFTLTNSRISGIENNLFKMGKAMTNS